MNSTPTSLCMERPSARRRRVRENLRRRRRVQPRGVARARGRRVVARVSARRGRAGDEPVGMQRGFVGVHSARPARRRRRRRRASDSREDEEDRGRSRYRNGRSQSITYGEVAHRDLTRPR
ncbi:uncharacterized protein MICPUCDRAFT_68910 [Micromonas pusilla CCMP1545]|uniref:Predicted protein n=1 Tax=Micromonas pusilla (strain CCMP1545) TaxID=564608 RepID=C1MYK9_MICPC|nr:uncharacterized protein MICPUCDRAFT_68910 [Micromonas pusilla CCMP1545]EEH55062.1 predicted protein [Micromonas pusilla CCMP1545]|eukprot:XP_003060293.1 predicted protein [Micromonas pusilla CCMP1545]